VGHSNRRSVTRYELELLIKQMDHELHTRGLIVNTQELKTMAKRLRREHEESTKYTSSTIIK